MVFVILRPDFGLSCGFLVYLTEPTPYFAVYERFSPWPIPYYSENGLGCITGKRVQGDNQPVMHLCQDYLKCIGIISLGFEVIPDLGW